MYAQGEFSGNQKNISLGYILFCDIYTISHISFWARPLQPFIYVCTLIPCFIAQNNVSSHRGGVCIALVDDYGDTEHWTKVVEVSVLQCT